MPSLKVSKPDQCLLAVWAADCAERVLPIFERSRPKDDRARKAIEAGRAWAHGEIGCGSSARKGGWGARAAAIAAHDAARAAANDPQAKAAARAAGHAAAVAHMPGHAKGAAMYALKAVGADADKERAWQVKHAKRLPERLRPVVDVRSQVAPRKRRSRTQAES